MGSNGWITHNGQGAPDLPPGTRVQVRLRSGDVWDTFVSMVNWDHPVETDGVEAYRVVPDER